MYVCIVHTYIYIIHKIESSILMCHGAMASISQSACQVRSSHWIKLQCAQGLFGRFLSHGGIPNHPSH